MLTQSLASPTDELDHRKIDNKITTRDGLATVYERLVHMLYHTFAGILEKINWG
jgi:hypothetical protein